MSFFGLFRRPPSAAAVARALTLMDAGDYAEAAKLLGGASDAEALAALGECQFQMGRAAEAWATTEAALHLSRDPAILGNLYEVHRYLGNAAQAAAICDELGEHYRRQAALVRAGEPLLRVVAEVSGQRHEIDEILGGIAGGVRFHFERNRLTLRNAVRWTEEGEALAHRGEFEAALALFARAAALDPHAPEPAYQAGHVLAHQGRDEEARARFREVERLAPGWFLSRTALSLVGHPAYRDWHALAEGPLPDALKRQLVERAVTEHPTLAPLHHLRGRLLRNLPTEAERAYRRGLEHADEPSLIARLCVDLAAAVRSPQEKGRLVRRAVELNADLVAAATARIVLAFE